jgi:hypothetical protein
MDSTEDPIRLARKAETVLQGRSDRVLLILEHVSDDFNHVAILRTCEALGVLRVWLIEARPSARCDGDKFDGLREGSARGVDGMAAASRAARRLQARAAQRGFEYDKLMGLRRAQLCEHVGG